MQNMWPVEAIFLRFAAEWHNAFHIFHSELVLILFFVCIFTLYVGRKLHKQEVHTLSSWVSEVALAPFYKST